MMHVNDNCVGKKRKSCSTARRISRLQEAVECVSKKYEDEFDDYLSDDESHWSSQHLVTTLNMQQPQVVNFQQSNIFQEHAVSPEVLKPESDFTVPQGFEPDFDVLECGGQPLHTHFHEEVEILQQGDGVQRKLEEVQKMMKEEVGGQEQLKSQESQEDCQPSPNLTSKRLLALQTVDILQASKEIGSFVLMNLLCDACFSRNKFVWKDMVCIVDEDDVVDQFLRCLDEDLNIHSIQEDGFGDEDVNSGVLQIPELHIGDSRVFQVFELHGIDSGVSQVPEVQILDLQTSSLPEFTKLQSTVVSQANMIKKLSFELENERYLNMVASNEAVRKISQLQEEKALLKMECSQVRAEFDLHKVYCWEVHDALK